MLQAKHPYNQVLKSKYVLKHYPVFQQFSTNLLNILFRLLNIYILINVYLSYRFRALLLRMLSLFIGAQITLKLGGNKDDNIHKQRSTKISWIRIQTRCPTEMSKQKKNIISVYIFFQICILQRERRTYGRSKLHTAMLIGKRNLNT